MMWPLEAMADASRAHAANHRLYARRKDFTMVRSGAIGGRRPSIEAVTFPRAAVADGSRRPGHLDHPDRHGVLGRLGRRDRPAHLDAAVAASVSPAPVARASGSFRASP